jgi:hypothetical protein
MSDEDKTKQRAAEIANAIRVADAKKADDDKKRQDEQRQQGNIDKLLSALDGLTSGMKDFSARLDALEAGHLKMQGGTHRGERVVPSDDDRGEPGDGKHLPKHPQYDDDHGKVREPGEPRSTVADSDDDAIFGRGGKQPLFWERQSAADTACRAWGAAAVPPLHGEQLLDYRRRLMRPLMKHSKEFAAVDLDELREPLLTPIEKSVFADAIRASHDNSSVPADYLREVTTTDHTGRRITNFYGMPKTWMREFSGQRRRLIGIKTHFDH